VRGWPGAGLAWPLAGHRGRCKLFVTPVLEERACAFVVSLANELPRQPSRVILFGLAANSKDATKLTLFQECFSYEPYALMLRRNGPAFRLAVDRALAGLYRSRAVIPIYEKWFGPIGRATSIIQAMCLLNALPE
jgi:hypothetical protein